MSRHRPAVAHPLSHIRGVAFLVVGDIGVETDLAGQFAADVYSPCVEEKVFIAVVLLRQCILEHGVHDKVEILYMHFIEIGRGFVKILRDRFFAPVIHPVALGHPFQVVHIQAADIVGVHFGELHPGFLRVLVHRGHDMPAAEGPCFGIIKERIGATFDLQPLHQYIGLISRGEIGGLRKKGKGYKDKGQSYKGLFNLHGVWFWS